MKMGRERAILRWDVRASLLGGRIERLEQTLSSLAPSAGARERERQLRLEQELDALRAQLAALGPSPRAKMG